MAKSNDPAENKFCCLLDSDVILNWLAQEEDPVAKLNLWDAPHKIMRLIESEIIDGQITLLSLMEIRFVLKRKKNLSEHKIRDLVNALIRLVKVIVPDEINLLEANGLQEEHFLSPIDAIILAVAMSLKDRSCVLVTRDNVFSNIARKILPSLTPEEFLKKLK